MNEFEQKLSRQPLRQISARWRAGTLAAAESAANTAKRSEDSSTVNLISWWRELFWPHPKAWASLAAVWVFIFALNFSMRDKMPMIVEKVLPPSPEVVAELRQQKLLFAQLIGSSDAREAEPPKFSPRPRTEHVEILTA